jgi:hypothetical protein
MANEADSRGGFDDKVTITLERERAEDLYYALLLALDGRDYSEGWVGKNGKNGSKG